MVQMVPGTPRRKGIKSSINIIKTKPPPKTVAFFFFLFSDRENRGDRDRPLFSVFSCQKNVLLLNTLRFFTKICGTIAIVGDILLSNLFF